MTGIDVVSVIETIDPKYFLPIHFTDDGKTAFNLQYIDNVEACGCKYLDLEYFSSKTFN